MANKPGAQFRDHPTWSPDAPPCRGCWPTSSAINSRRNARRRPAPVAPIAEARPGIAVGEALARLRCQACGQPPEIAALSLPSVKAGETWLALRIEADRWKPNR
ncbi:hypothetical protein [Falsiroseomonas sp. E2-1-a20]|uniref:hypothetical protein n=1 Tax=Falsiroseomonas sp. E2-1-a20 TaxID=3239300 RepID=UPI003F33F35B